MTLNNYNRYSDQKPNAHNLEKNGVMPTKELLRIPEAAKRLGMKTPAAYYAAQNGYWNDFLVRPTPHQLRVDPDRLEEFIRRGGVRQAESELMAQAA